MRAGQIKLDVDFARLSATSRVPVYTDVAWNPKKLDNIIYLMLKGLDISDCRHFIESEVIKNLLEVRFELSDKASRIASIVLSSEDEEEGLSIYLFILFIK